MNRRRERTGARGCRGSGRAESSARANQNRPPRRRQTANGSAADLCCLLVKSGRTTVLALTALLLPLLLASVPAGDVPFRVLRLAPADCCPGLMEAVLEVAASPPDPARRVVIQGRMDRIEAVTQVAGGSRFLVQGLLPRGGHTLTLVEAATGKQFLTLWCHRYSISPSGTFLVYESWYPRMAPQAGGSSLIQLDLTREDLPETPPERLSFSTPPGQAVYPDKSRQAYPEDEAHIFLSPFLWSQSEQLVVFVEFYRQKNHLVALNFDPESGVRTVRKRTITLEEVAKPGAMTSETSRKLERDSYKLTILEMHWLDSGRVEARPYPQYWLPETIELRLP